MSKTADRELLYNFEKNSIIETSNKLALGRHTGIELGRITACLAVIIIHQDSNHYGSHYNTHETLDLASRWAVPFFFIASGYFMPFRSGWWKVILKYFIRLLPVFVFWTTAYAAINDNTFWFLSNKFEILETIAKGGGGFHLWFLPSLGVCLAISAIMRHYLPLAFLLVVAASLYCFGLANASYEAPIIGIPFSEVDRSFNPRNGPFMGLLFVSLGIALRTRMFNLSTSSGLILIFIGSVLSFMEAKFLSYYFGTPISSHDFLIGTIPFGLGFFIFFKNFNIENYSFSKYINNIGKFSLGVYAIHLMVLWGATNMIEPKSLASGILTAVLTLIISISFALVGSRTPVLKRFFC